MGEREWANSGGAVVAIRDGLVKRLARWGQNGKQRRERGRSLSRLELARAEIPLRRTQNHCVRPRNYRHRSGRSDNKGRLLARDLYIKYKSLSDRAARESRSGS